MLQYFGADDQVKAAVLKRQLQDIAGRQRPASAAVLSQTVVQLETAAGFGKIIKIEINANGRCPATLVGRTGMAAGTAADVKNFETVCEVQSLKFHRDHE